MSQYKFGDRVWSEATGEGGTYIEGRLDHHRVYMDYGHIAQIGDANIRRGNPPTPSHLDPESFQARMLKPQPTPGQIRKTAAQARRDDRTQHDYAAAGWLLNSMLACDGLADPRRVGEIVWDLLADRHRTIYADATLIKRMERLTDHLATAAATIAVIIENTQAAEAGEVPARYADPVKAIRPSDHEGNGWDDIDTNGGDL